METIRRSFKLVKSSYLVLLHDKELVLLPLLSGFFSILVVATFFIPLAFLDSRYESGIFSQMGEIELFGLLFLMYFILYTISYFFKAAVISSAIFRMRGGDPTVRGGIRVAWNHIGRIMGLALFSATVGMVLRMLESRTGKLGAFVSGLLGIAWSLASFLVLPVLLIERKSALDALKESVALVKKTWGEQVAASAAFGVIGAVLAGVFIFATTPLFMIGFAAEAEFTLFLLFGLQFLFIVLIFLVMSTLHSIYTAALYMYVRTGTVPPEFSAKELHASLH